MLPASLAHCTTLSEVALGGTAVGIGSSTLIRGSVGSVTVNESVSPGRMGRSPESRHLVHERFHTVPWPWNGPALYVTEQCRGKRRQGQIEKGCRGLAGNPFYEGHQLGARAEWGK